MSGTPFFTLNPINRIKYKKLILLEFFNVTLFKQLIPLYVCVGAGCIGAVLYTLRLAVRNPDVQWNRTGEISNEEFRDKQYKV